MRWEKEDIIGFLVDVDNETDGGQGFHMKVRARWMALRVVHQRANGSLIGPPFVIRKILMGVVVGKKKPI